MIPNKANSTSISTSSSHETCVKSNHFNHPVAPPSSLSNPFISPPSFNQFQGLGMHPLLTNLLPSIALSYQLSILASRPFQGLQNPMAPSPVFLPPLATTLPHMDSGFNLNPSSNEAQRISDTFPVHPSIESYLKRSSQICNPFLNKIPQSINSGQFSNNGHPFTSYPDLWLDFQRKCQLMMEEMKRKEQINENEVSYKVPASKQSNDSANRNLHAQVSNTPCAKILPFPSQILQLHSSSQSNVSNCTPHPTSSPQPECSPVSPDYKSLSNYIDPPKALQQALRATNGEPLLITPPSVSHKSYRERVNFPVSISGSETTQTSRFKCQICKRSYSTATGLHKHREQHCQGEQSQRQFSCQHCSKVYHSMSALKMHIRTHTLPCKCALCGKAFSRMWLLNGHIRTHTGEKPFSCHICARAFADRSNLRAHMQTHSEVKRYRCSHCDKTFSRMGLLTKHKASGCNVRYSNGESSFHSETSEIHDPSQYQ